MQARDDVAPRHWAWAVAVDRNKFCQQCTRLANEVSPLPPRFGSRVLGHHHKIVRVFGGESIIRLPHDLLRTASSAPTITGTGGA